MDRKYVGEIVLITQKRLELNDIVHPIVREIMEEEKQSYLNQGYDVIMDIPLLLKMNYKIQLMKYG